MKFRKILYLLVFFVSFPAVYAYDGGETVFVGENNIIHAFEVVEHYIMPKLSGPAQQEFREMLESEAPGAQAIVKRAIKKELFEIFLEELYLYEGLHLYKRKNKRTNIFLYNEGEERVFLPAKEMRRERQRVRGIIEYFKKDQLASTNIENRINIPNPLAEEEAPLLDHEVMPVSPAEVRNFYQAHRDQFLYRVSADVFEIKVVTSDVLELPFHREALNDEQREKIKEIFFKVLDNHYVGSENLQESDKHVLWNAIINREDTLSLRESILENTSLFEELKMDINGLFGIEKGTLAYELHNKMLVYQYFYKLLKYISKDVSDNEEYMQKAYLSQKEVNAIFPGLVRIKVLEDIRAYTMNEDVHPSIHGSFVFPQTEVDAKRWLISLETGLPKHTFFLLRIIQDNQKNLELGELVRPEMTLYTNIKYQLALKKLESAMFAYTKSIFHRYFTNLPSFYIDRETRKIVHVGERGRVLSLEDRLFLKRKKMSTLFPHSEYNLTYEEVESAFSK